MFNKRLLRNLNLSSAAFLLICYSGVALEAKAVDPDQVVVSRQQGEIEERGKGFIKRSREADLVDGFPIITMPSKTKLINSSVKRMDSNLEGMQALYLSELSVPEAVQFFHLQMLKDGWQSLTPTKSLYSQHEEFIEFKKAELKINISVEHENEKTEISVEIPVR